MNDEKRIHLFLQWNDRDWNDPNDGNDENDWVVSAGHYVTAVPEVGEIVEHVDVDDGVRLTYQLRVLSRRWTFIERDNGKSTHEVTVECALLDRNSRRER